MKTVLLIVCCGSIALTQSVWADEAKTATATQSVTATQYSSFDEAMRAERKLRDLDELDQRRHALQSAMKMAKRPRDRCEVHRLLISVHALADELLLMCDSLDYVIENAPQPATASLTLRSAITTVLSKEWETEFKDVYESKLASDPKDRTALTVLAKVAHLIARDHSLHGMYLDRLVALDREQGKPVDPEMINRRAFAYMLVSKNVESAELYQTVSREFEDYASYSLVKAATSWERAREFDKSLEAAKRAHQIGPDKRASRDMYNWHRDLGEIFLRRVQPAEAVEHLEAAKEAARIDAYREQCEDLLLQAKAILALKN